MKRLLLTLIMSLAFCGSIFADDDLWNPNGHESYWEFNYHDYQMQKPFVAAIQIDGQIVTADFPNCFDLEVAAFVGDDECRANQEYLYNGYVEEYGDPFPILDGFALYFTEQGDQIYFKMYDHLNNVLYENCTITLLGEEIAVYTGEEHMEGWWDPENPIMLCFTSPETESITKTIIGYDEEGGGWNLISSPVGQVPVADVNNMTINDFDLYSFDQIGDEEGNEWMNYELGTEEFGFENLEAGKGYLYANIATVTLEFPGTAYTGEGTFPLEYSEENADENMWGWNLMGNPYNAVATVDRPFYRMVNDAFVSCDEGMEIDPMEGVIVSAEGADETVTFATSGEKTATLALNLTNGSKLVDRAIVGFGNGLRLPKLQFNRNSSKVYFTMDNKDYAVVRSEGMGEMPVSFKAESNGTYSLTLSSNADFAYLHLIDNLTGADQDLLVNPTYTFEAKTTDYASRFRLVFATGNDEDNFAFFSNGSLIINNEGNATLQVVDVTGRIIKCESINGCANVNIDAASGVYMVRLVNGDNVKVQKIVR